MEVDKKYAAVIGDPISHSLSPEIHNYWIKKYNINAEYRAIRVKKEELSDFIKNISKENLEGINVTVPHKERAFEIVRNISDLNKEIISLSAINTVFLKEGRIFADNTDIYGFLENMNISQMNFISGKNVMIIGAGGAAKAIISALISKDVKKIFIANRTKEKIDALKEIFSVEIEGIYLQEIEDYANNNVMIVNASSMGLLGKNDINLNFEKISKEIICYDIVYNPLYTKFLRDARNNGNKIITGLGMLIYQAAPAFKKFFGIFPEIENIEEEFSFLFNRFN